MLCQLRPAGDQSPFTCACGHLFAALCSKDVPGYSGSKTVPSCPHRQEWSKLWDCPTEGSPTWGLISPLAFQLAANLYHFRHKDSTTPLCTGSMVWALVLFILVGLLVTICWAELRLFRGRSFFPPQWPYRAMHSRSSAAAWGAAGAALVAAPCSHFRGLTFQRWRVSFCKHK